jgi:hypothetical protein
MLVLEGFRWRDGLYTAGFLVGQSYDSANLKDENRSVVPPEAVNPVTQHLNCGPTDTAWTIAAGLQRTYKVEAGETQPRKAEQSRCAD